MDRIQTRLAAFEAFGNNETDEIATAEKSLFQAETSIYLRAGLSQGLCFDKRIFYLGANPQNMGDKIWLKSRSFEAGFSEITNLAFKSISRTLELQKGKEKISFSVKVLMLPMSYCN